MIAGAGSHLGAGAHREGGEDTGAPGAGTAGAQRDARAAGAQADGRGAAAHGEPDGACESERKPCRPRTSRVRISPGRSTPRFFESAAPTGLSTTGKDCDPGPRPHSAHARDARIARGHPPSSHPPRLTHHDERRPLARRARRGRVRALARVRAKASDRRLQGEDPRGPSHGLRVQHPAHSRPTRALRRRRRRAHPPRRRQVRRGHGQGHPVPVEPRRQVGFRPRARARAVRASSRADTRLRPSPAPRRTPTPRSRPSRPPSEYLDTDPQGFLKEDDQMSFLRLRNRAGMWYQLAPILPKLMRSGFLPDDIFDETGIEPREQSLWQTWTSTRGSLIERPAVPRREARVL